MQSAAGAFLSADAAASSQHASCTAHNVFHIIDLDGYGTVALKSAHGSSYLQAAAAGAVRMADAESSGAVGLRQTFLIDEVPAPRAHDVWRCTACSAFVVAQQPL